MACHFLGFCAMRMENIERRSHTFQGARLGRQFSQASMRFALSLAKKKAKKKPRRWFFFRREQETYVPGDISLPFSLLHCLAAQGEILELLLERSKKTKKSPYFPFFSRACSPPFPELFSPFFLSLLLFLAAFSPSLPSQGENNFQYFLSLEERGGGSCQVRLQGNTSFAGFFFFSLPSSPLKPGNSLLGVWCGTNMYSRALCSHRSSASNNYMKNGEGEGNSTSDDRVCISVSPDGCIFHSSNCLARGHGSRNELGWRRRARIQTTALL